jgi:cell division protein FtsI (penicillin-binding protein 3)
MGLQTSKISLESKFDVRRPLKIGTYSIHDYRSQKRTLSLPDVFLYSSNIAVSKIGLRVGSAYQKLFFSSLGLRDRIAGGRSPLFSHQQSDLQTATLSFGQGFAITPLHVASAMATLTNPEGRVVRPTYQAKTQQVGISVVDPEVSKELRSLLRLNAEKGSAQAINVGALQAGGMTSTSDKIFNGKYAPEKVVTAMVGIIPFNNPQYVFVTVFDEPEGIPETHGYKTAAWNAGYVTGKIIEEAAPKLGIDRQ